MKIVNLGAEDFHTHTITFSDGFNSIDEMVIHAGKINMKKLCITDHSQFYLDKQGYARKTNRNIIERWENIHNDVEVSFGVEADIMNEAGEISFDIQGIESDFIILSAHIGVYQGNPNKITEAYLSAIDLFGDRIAFLGHLCSVYFEKYLHVTPVIDAALEKGIAFELNCANLMGSRTNMKNLKKLLSRAERLYVNSDAHTLSQLQVLRRYGFDFLKKEGCC